MVHLFTQLEYIFSHQCRFFMWLSTFKLLWKHAHSLHSFIVDHNILWLVCIGGWSSWPIAHDHPKSTKHKYIIHTIKSGSTTHRNIDRYPSIQESKFKYRFRPGLDFGYFELVTKLSICIPVNYSSEEDKRTQ